MNFESRFMAISCRSAIAGLVAVTVGIGFSTAAIAQDYPLVSGVPFGQLPQKVENTFFTHSPDFYGNRTLGGQLKVLLGTPENYIARDGKAVNELYREVLYKQVNAGPIIRTLDLPSPYPYSVRDLPASVVVMPNESAPPPVVIFPEAPQPLPQAIPQKPVPGLW